MGNSKEQAQTIFKRLQSDPQFEHFGMDSRGISLPTDIVTAELTTLANDTIDPFARQFLHYAAGMLKKVGEHGTYVRIKYGKMIQIRGNTGEMPEKPTETDILRANFHRENHVAIDLSGSEPFLNVGVCTAGDEDELKKQINSVVNQMPQQAKDAVVSGILDIITSQLDQILDA